MMKTNINVELMKAVKERLWGLWEWDWCSKIETTAGVFYDSRELGQAVVLVKYQTLMMIVFMIFILGFLLFHVAKFWKAFEMILY